MEHSSEGEEDSDDNVKKTNENSIIETNTNFEKSTYILIDGKDILNITITPTFLKVLNDIITIYSNKTLSIVGNKRCINLVNDIGPQSKIELYENRGTEEKENNVLVCFKTFENQDSYPSSPVKNYFNEESNEDKDR